MSFDRLAPHYRWIETISAGNKLQRCRVAWLEEVAHCRQALVIGEGNGRFLAACVTKLPDTQFTVVDGSKAMLRLAEKRWRVAGGDGSKVNFVHATLPGVKLPAQHYDLIVTHFFLDCFTREELPGIVAEIASFAAPSCHWLLADFALPENGFAHWRARAILRLAYTFFRWTTGLSGHHLVSPAPFMETAGFTRTNHLEMDWQLLFSDVWKRS